MENGHYWVDYTFGELKHYGSILTVNIPAIRKEYERVSALTPEQAMAEYKRQKETRRPAPAVSPETVNGLIASMDDKGAWITDIRIPNYQDTINGAVRVTKGISTSVFVRNMQTLMNFVLSQKK